MNEIPPLPRGINMESVPSMQKQITRTVAADCIAIAAEDLETKMAQENAIIAKKRKEVFESSGELKAVIYKNMPHYLHESDVIKTIEFTTQEYPILLQVAGNIYGFNDIGEMATILKTNITQSDIKEMVEELHFRGEPITLNEQGLALLEDLYDK